MTHIDKGAFLNLKLSNVGCKHTIDFVSEQSFCGVDFNTLVLSSKVIDSEAIVDSRFTTLELLHCDEIKSNALLKLEADRINLIKAGYLHTNALNKSSFKDMTLIENQVKLAESALKDCKISKVGLYCAKDDVYKGYNNCDIEWVFTDKSQSVEYIDKYAFINCRITNITQVTKQKSLDAKG